VKATLFLIASFACVYIASAQALYSDGRSDTVVSESTSGWEVKSMRLNSRIDSLQAKFNTIINGDITVDALVRQIRERQVKKGRQVTDSVKRVLQRQVDSLSALNLPTETISRKIDSAHTRAQASLEKITGQFGENEHFDSILLQEAYDPLKGISNATEGTKEELDKEIANWSQVPQRQIDQLKAMEEVQAVEGKVGEANTLIDKTQACQKDVASLVKGKVGDLETIPEAIEKRVVSMAEMQELQKQTGEITKYQDLLASGNDPEALKTMAKQQAVKYAKDHFLGKEAALMAAMDKLSKVNGKYGDVASLKDFPKRVPNQMKGKPFIERMVPGFQFQVQKSATLLLDLSPTVGYRFTGRITAGVGWNERISFREWNQTVAEDRIFGPRAFTLFNLKKGFSLKAEGERMNVSVPTFVSAVESHRTWVWSAFAGIQRDYTFYKNIRGNVQFLYNLYDPDNSPYLERFNMRMGFEFPMKRR
jgi:hypothetical protein